MRITILILAFAVVASLLPKEARKLTEHQRNRARQDQEK